MPEKATKHISTPQAPIGAVKNGKIKVIDGDSQTVRWRQGTTGMSRDFDGDPVAQNKNRSGLKNRPKHSAKMGRKKTHKAHMGGRDGAYEE